ncbi:38032_t:CDS:2 [Gigaspora margarita]|uniref:38032_t:CDS:1 n=1 Tax=Gigaspora margarita TaxID=4874 RepID=A0ABN7VR19_GIGMA|nr:38032_t:CDS:2 [Gigaspora margarita]
MVNIVLEKVKAYSRDKQNEKADQIAKEGGEANVLIRVKQQLLITATRAEWTFNQGAHDEIHQKRIKAKGKIDLGPNWLREVFIHRNKEEYKNQHIEWSKEFLADNIGLALERMNLFKNKAQNIAVTFLDKWLTFF